MLRHTPNPLSNLGSILTVVLVLAAGTQTSMARNDNPGISPIHSHASGQTYGEWAADWWTWAWTTPFAEHPLMDFAGPRDCAGGQSGSVWFLGGDFFGFGDPITRQCVVPSGTSLFFPLLNNGWFGFLNDPEGQRTEEFVNDVRTCEPPTVLTATIDGRAVVMPEQYYEVSPWFEVQLGEDNWLGLVDCDDPTPPGTPEGCAEGLVLEPSADTGYYLLVRPLQIGEHTIQWYGEWVCPAWGDDPLIQNVSYTIEVVGD